MSLGSGTRLGPYEIVVPIGAGGMGEVYRARDTKLGRDVAIKVLPEEFAADPERIARFEREAKLLASLNHPNIASIHGFEESDGISALVLELVEGPTLAGRVELGPIHVDEAIAIAKQLAEALEAGHEAGIIHRDLKPANVKVKEDGAVKVLDYGLAKALESNEPPGTDSQLSQSPTLTRQGTQVGVILGTAAYMSPEQANGKRVDKRTDIFSFGAVLYEMLSARNAFAGEDVSDTLAFVLTKEADWNALPTETPAALRSLLARCLEKDPKKRLRDIGEARIVLSDPMTSPSSAEASGPSPRERPWAWIAVSAVLLVALVVTLMSCQGGIHNSQTLRSTIPLPKGLTFHQVLSPDGQYLAIQAVGDEKPYVFVRALDSWEFRRLEDTAYASFPFWSPDSGRIGFFDASNKLKIVDVKGGPSEEVAEVQGLLTKNGAWGADGVIVISTSNKFSPGPLLSVPASGGTPTPLTRTEPGEGHLWPSFLPDGTHFVYTSRGGSAHRQY